MVRFPGINFQGYSEILENSEIYCPRNFPTIRYQVPTLTALLASGRHYTPAGCMQLQWPLVTVTEEVHNN